MTLPGRAVDSGRNLDHNGHAQKGQRRAPGHDDNSYYEVNSNTASTRPAAWYAPFTAVPSTLRALRLS